MWVVSLSEGGRSCSGMDICARERQGRVRGREGRWVGLTAALNAFLLRTDAGALALPLRCWAGEGWGTHGSCYILY